MQKQKCMGRWGDKYAYNKTQFYWQLAVSACYGWLWPALHRMMLHTDTHVAYWWLQDFSRMNSFIAAQKDEWMWQFVLKNQHWQS